MLKWLVLTPQSKNPSKGGKLAWYESSLLCSNWNRKFTKRAMIEASFPRSRRWQFNLKCLWTVECESHFSCYTTSYKMGKIPIKIGVSGLRISSFILSQLLLQWKHFSSVTKIL